MKRLFWGDDIVVFEPTAIQKNIDLKSYLLMANTLFDRAKRVQIMMLLVVGCYL